MKTLKDIKEALINIPDDVLEKTGFGIGENAEEEITLLVYDDNFIEIYEKYPDLEKISRLVDTIKKAQGILDEQDNAAVALQDKLQEEGISHDYFDKDEREHV